MEQPVARQLHRLEVAGSSPAPAPRIGVRIQHHPARAGLLPDLLSRLGVEAEVVTDPEPDDRLPSPWRTYLECLTRPPGDATHLLVLQDDVTPCRNLVAACERIAAVRSEPVCLFLGGAPVRSARLAGEMARRGRRYVPIHSTEFVPVVAVLWPVALAADLAVWSSTARLPGNPPRSDDAVVGRWSRRQGQAVVATTPSLVQHPDVVPSLIGERRNRAGRNSWRVAHSWIGDRDPLSIDWSLD